MSSGGNNFGCFNFRVIYQVLRDLPNEEFLDLEAARSARNETAYLAKARQEWTWAVSDVDRANERQEMMDTQGSEWNP